MTVVSDPIRGTSEPGRYWTSTNLGEAVPDVMSPMCWSFWEEPEELGWLYSMYALGVLRRDQLVVSPDVNDRGLSVFYGRQALNVDAIRKTLAGLPGFKADDFERDLMGSVRADAPQYPPSMRRLPVVLFKAPRTLRSISGRIRTTHDDIRTWWFAEVFEGATTASASRPVDRLVVARERFSDMFSLHCVVRFMFQGVQSAITGAAAKAGAPHLVSDVLSGVGDVNETRMSDDLWRLAHGELDENAFLHEWGFHGPNEGNVYTLAWREDPAPVRALARSYARRTDSERPLAREAKAVQAGAAAEQRLLAATSAAQRPTVRWLLARARNIVRTLHIGKAGYLMTIDAARAAARAFGAEQVEKGVFREVDDVFFFSIEECQQIDVGALADIEEIVTQRRKTRDAYQGMELPIAFYGMPEPVEVGGSGQGTRSDGHAEFSGAASGGGVVEGRARVVTDPAAEVDLEDGDILVCRFTDPSWAPLMSLAEALVIDMGGSASHGAVVARELGIPYVIGTEVGTTALRDGDRILVDGDRNLVRLLQATDTVV